MDWDPYLECDSVTHVVTRFTGITSVQYKGGGPWSSSCARWPSLDAMHCPLSLCFSLFLSVSLSNTNMPMQKKKKKLFCTRNFSCFFKCVPEFMF